MLGRLQFSSQRRIKRHQPRHRPVAGSREVAGAPHPRTMLRSIEAGATRDSFLQRPDESYL